LIFSLAYFLFHRIFLAIFPGFSPVAWLSFVLLGFGLLIHITLVNVVLGLSIIVPITEYIGSKTKDPDMERLAKRLFRYLALSDLVAGVFGTWVAIELTAFWPGLLYIFTTVLFIPTMIALIGIFMAIPSIAIYWYGWDRMSKKKHLAVGGFMALGALLVPAGFRMFFAFVDNSGAFNLSSLTGAMGNVDTNVLGMFTNPIYITLLVHSWFGGLTMATLFAAGAFGWSFNRNKSRTGKGNRSLITGSRSFFESPKVAQLAGGTKWQSFTLLTKTANLFSQPARLPKNFEQEGEPAETRREAKYVRYLVRVGFILLIIQSAIGVVYFFILERYSPYVYAAITGNTSVAAYNFALVFIPFMFFVALMWVSTVILFLKVRNRNAGTPSIPKLASLVLMLASFLALPLGEAANDASKAPYMILNGLTGISANSVVNNHIPINWGIAVVALIVAVVSIAIFLTTVYFIFIRKMEPPQVMR
jgi:cytochrome bd-type quinol oxidase subunit 1